MMDVCTELAVIASVMGGSCRTDETATVVPTPSTKYGVPTVGPTIVVPSDVNANGLPIVSACAAVVVMIAFCVALADIASVGDDGCVMDETGMGVPVPSTKYGVPTDAPITVAPSDEKTKRLPIVRPCGEAVGTSAVAAFTASASESADDAMVGGGVTDVKADVTSVLLPVAAPKTKLLGLSPPRSGRTVMDVVEVDEKTHTFVHDADADTEKALPAAAQA